MHTFFLTVYYIDNGDYNNLSDRHGVITRSALKTDDLVCHKFPVDDSFSVGGGMVFLAHRSFLTCSFVACSFVATRYKGDTLGP